MVDFNPIRDLRSPEADHFHVPAGQSTQEVEDIRLRLVLTREKTENVVKIIKNKGLTFKKDIEKIQELQRRLRTTIPRIPILRGDASTQIGAQVGVQKRRGMSGLDFSRFFRSTKTATKTSFPLLDVIITALVFYLSRGKSKTKVNVDPKAINKIKEFIRVKPKVLPKIGEKVTPFRDPSKVIPFKKSAKTTKGKVIEGDASTKTVDVDYEVVSDEPILARLANIFKTRKLKKFSKEKGFVQFSKRADKLQKLTKVPFELRPYDTKLEVNRYVTQLQRAASGKTNQKYPDFNSIDNLFTTNRADLKVMLKQRKTQLQNLTPGTEDYKNMQTSIRLVERGITRINNAYTRYLKKMDLQIIRAVRLERQNRNIIKRQMRRMNKEGEELLGLPKSERIKILQNQEKGKKFMENLENILSGSKDGAFLNTKPMNNDLAMLNTNTGYRKTVVIAVDSDSIG